MYNRLLAYVYRDSDDLFVNVELIRQGYGKTGALSIQVHEIVSVS